MSPGCRLKSLTQVSDLCSCHWILVLLVMEYGGLKKLPASDVVGFWHQDLLQAHKYPAPTTGNTTSLVLAR
eukprot:CAMPEP_0175989298 /NCGR_PEP_ID=MMETSP0108-20121206/51693_1 /TAXON_ID=195067 ORGANISM="Goniomonas pacifica, Strain CCMP1869" /NCGR_SAMPLE_ID=MMETSP0108 /ASSEMBLY_ACC=CAM_ASM_000204 /LENGTH=70 /DNA_ID=CAMNT_0017320683 /DNA_START=259 /DNA_END=468 /DNA_ORIENTATION=-